jgi:hypothetical protein
MSTPQVPATSNNTSTFAPEPIGSFGNVARNRYHGPRINNTNFIVAKNFALSSDGVRTLRIRMERDNVFNHTQFLNSNRKLLIRQLRPGHISSRWSSDTARSEDLLLTSQILISSSSL